MSPAIERPAHPAEPASTEEPASPAEVAAPVEPPVLTIPGVEGSTLRVTLDGLKVSPRRSAPYATDRFWAFGDLRDLRIASYGAIGVIRATVRTTGTDLPLLLLEPDQILAARRAVEFVCNRLCISIDGRSAA